MINTETIQTEKRNQKEDKFHKQKDLLVKFRFFCDSWIRTKKFGLTEKVISLDAFLTVSSQFFV